jgi:hypothetical protein
MSGFAGKGLRPLVYTVGTAFWAFLLIILPACSPAPASQTAAPRPTSAFATVSGPVTRQTLPPTWTPSATATPSRTPTLTRTPTPVPTRSEADICAGFQLMHDFSGRLQYGWGDYIPIFAALDDPGSSLYFRATHRPSGEGTGFELPAGGQAVGIEFQIRALPRPGPYDWEMGVRSPVYGDICGIGGSFLALRPTPTPAITDTPAVSSPEPSPRP